MKIGIPRAMLFHRYKTLWKTFFDELGIETVISPKTDKSILDVGSRYGIDEACLSSKLLWGHIDRLADKCDAIFVPRYANYAGDGVLCTRFEALYEMAQNSFRDRDLKFICLDVDENERLDEEKAFERLAVSLGKTKAEGSTAYKKAYITWISEQNELDKNSCALSEGEGIKVLVVGHSYNVSDEYIGVPIIKTLKELGVTPIIATEVNLEKTRREYQKICKNVPWIVNRELLGAIARFKDRVDGIVLITAFPCGPDSMTNEMVIRRVKNIPILNLLLDSQDGNAGIDTRLESFVDIMRYRNV